MSLGIRYQSIQPETLFAHHCMARNRQLATTSQTAKEGAFGGAGQSGKFVIKFANSSDRCFIVCAGFKSERTLANSREHFSCE